MPVSETRDCGLCKFESSPKTCKPIGSEPRVHVEQRQQYKPVDATYRCLWRMQGRAGATLPVPVNGGCHCPMKSRGSLLKYLYEFVRCVEIAAGCQWDRHM